MQISKDFDRFITSVGQFIKYWGFKEIHGKTWALIYLYHRPLNSHELKTLLNISKAQLSKTIATLEKYDLIKASESGEHGVFFYSAEDNFMAAIIKVLKTRELNLINNALKISSDLLNAKNNDVDITHLKQITKMIKLADAGLKSILAFKQFDFSKWKLFKQNNNPK